MFNVLLHPTGGDVIPEQKLCMRIWQGPNVMHRITVYISKWLVLHNPVGIIHNLLNIIQCRRSYKTLAWVTI